MGTTGNAVLGITFWVIALVNTVLMFHLWGYPFDHERLQSAAPRRLMLLHHLLGYVFLGLYLFLMVQMVPRLWTYQVELPARTVAHLVMGIAIGTLLLVKILIVRFFRHLESTTAPLLGIGLLLGTTVLIGLSVPVALREAYLARESGLAAGPRPDHLERVRRLLPTAAVPAGVSVEALSSPAGLTRGRALLLTKCVQCHDLRTILARPRTPAAWVETVQRMAERAVLTPIPAPEQWHVAAYLVAISPDLQKAVQRQRHEEQARPSSDGVRKRLPVPAAPQGAPTSAARTAFETACNGCHGLAQVEEAPPRSAVQARELVARMVDNGLSADGATLEQIIGYLTATYAR